MSIFNESSFNEERNGVEWRNGGVDSYLSDLDDLNPNTAAARSDYFDRWQAHMGLKTFGQSLNAAAHAVFPTRTRSPYSKVYVLMISWETDDPRLPVSNDISRLFGVFRDIYHFDTQAWKIPDDSSNDDINERMRAFFNLGDDNDDHLKILYYAGDARLTQNGSWGWTRYKNSKHQYPTVEWSDIQSNMKLAQSDVLVLCDSCHSATTDSAEGNGTTELIAACSYIDTNNGERTYSFTRELEIELRELSKLPSFSIGNLYHNLFCRIQFLNSEAGREYPAPICLSLAQENIHFPRSLRLSVLKNGSEDLRSLPSQLTSEDSFEVQSPFLSKIGTNNSYEIPSFQKFSDTSPEQTPRMVFAIRLREDFSVGDLSSDLFNHWIGNLPASVDGVKIEAAFHSSTSLFIVSIPICMSIYMLKTPAIINLGSITSFNQVLNRFPIPKDLPTPNPDHFAWDNLEPRANGRRTEGHENGILSGINLSPKPELRKRKQVQVVEPIIGTAPRPPLEKAYSSQFSISGSITEEPSPVNGFDGNYESSDNTDDAKESHRIHPHGNYSREAGGPQSKGQSKIRTYSDDPDIKMFPRISKPVELLRNSYDCVVIGSGYGGAVAASRMSRAGQDVCLLERGKERWPGEYPSGFLDAAKQLHVSGEFGPDFVKGLSVEQGDPTGLYHLIVGKGQNAFVGNGLGGTSLLNANVFLEADKGTMSLPCWPEELRGTDKLKKYYNRAANVLEPVKYPQDWPELPKLTLLQKQAKELGMEEKFDRVPQTTRFVNGPNSTGVEMQQSCLTGMDTTGVNDGSKSSTLVNYLSDAWNWGAEMFCETEVRYVKKHPDPDQGYLVFFAWHGSKRGAFPENLYEDLMWVHAKKCVFLGAGSIGTTEILLRSKKLGLSMSDKVGVNMSGNGDMLAFGYNTDDKVNAIGRQYPSPYNPIGPTITGIIDCRHNLDNPLEGYVIEEGAIPKALSLLFQSMLELMPGNHFSSGGIISKVQHAVARHGSRFLGPYYKDGSIERTQVYLVMSHDANQAIMTLKDDKPVLEFLGVASSGNVRKLNGILEKATRAVGGTFVNNPFSAVLQQEITVHPIGGACMSNDGTPDNGVTNHHGEVFTGHGNETHQGLVVTDGSIIPAALGVNPFATITALAERSVEHAARDIGQRIDFKTRNDILDFNKPPHQYTRSKHFMGRQDTMEIADAKELILASRAAKTSGFGFSEVMTGYIHIGDGVEGDKIEDYETAAKTARGLCEEARFFLSVKSFDTECTVNRADHSAMLTGTFTSAGLKGSPFLVQRGDFHLFSVDRQAPGTRNLSYDFNMTSVEGEKFHFHGYKLVDSSVALAPWRFWAAASTLYVTISQTAEGGAQTPKILGRGMMHIKPSDFLSEIFTLKPSGRNLWAKLFSTASFMGYFAKQSASLFLAPLVWQQYPSMTYKGFINDTTPDSTINIIASDGISTFLHVWEPRNPNIATKNLFMVPGASVDQQIFALPTIEVNAVNYFTRAGYRVFVTVHRIGILPVAGKNYTTFDARLDIKACLQWIRKEHGCEKIYTIAHCMGSVAFSCGLLDGTIPTNWILGISCSQVFFNPIWSALGLIKASAGPIPFDKLYKLFGGNWFSCHSTRDDSYFQQLLNQILRFYPDNREEICNNVSCHRTSLVFGRLWNHRNLNEATHRQIDRFFGGVNMTLLHCLMQMGVRGAVTSNAPLFDDLTTPENIERLRGIPVMLFSGADNQVLTPAATEKSYDILRNKFGWQQYERHVVQGYGHLDCWMGRSAYKDVYPLVRGTVDRVVRGEAYKYREPDWGNDWRGWRELPKSG